MTTHISLITSLYRGEQHLPAYGQRLRAALEHLRRAGLSAEVLVIANDPTPKERAYLANLPVRVIETERETLYASWNRGIAAMHSDVFGVWNVDDARDGAALVETYALLQQGHTLVDAPMRVEQTWTTASQIARNRVYFRSVFIHETGVFTRKHCMNPFALIHRRLFDQVGLFDPHFRVVGDLEWSGRAQLVANIGLIHQPGGTFYLHGGNLSSTGSIRQMIEENIIFLRRQQWDEVRPTPEPEAMREMWEAWGNPNGIAVPPETAAMLWGYESSEAWQTWQRDHAQRQNRLKWRTRVLAVTDRLGLTPFLRRWRQSL
jgi:hypothetical protein